MPIRSWGYRATITGGPVAGHASIHVANGPARTARHSRPQPGTTTFSVHDLTDRPLSPGPPSRAGSGRAGQYSNSRAVTTARASLRHCVTGHEDDFPASRQKSYVTSNAAPPGVADEKQCSKQAQKPTIQPAGFCRVRPRRKSIRNGACNK